MFKLRLNPFYDVDDASGVTAPLTTNDIFDLLGDDDASDKETDETKEEIKLEANEEEGDKDSEPDDKEDEGDKSLEDELEDELEAEAEPNLDDADIADLNINRQEILKAFPEIFKKFPDLEKAIYRYRQISEYVTTPKEAEQLATKAELLDNFGKDLSNGDVRKILKAVKDEDPETFNNLADNYLVQLNAVSSEAYQNILGNVLRNAAIAMSQSADEDDKIAAKLLHKFFFNSEQLTQPRALGRGPKEADPKETELTKREQEFRTEVLNTHIKTVNTRVDRLVTHTISKNIDPKGSMNDFTKDRAVELCSRTLENKIDGDTRFQKILDKLWERAAENDFDKKSLDRIHSAYVSKAKELLPEIIRNTRTRALKGISAKDNNSSRNRGPLPVGSPRKSTPNNSRPISSGNSDKDKARAIPKGMSSRDYLMKD